MLTVCVQPESVVSVSNVYIHSYMYISVILCAS